jgi:hypothetical protein
MAINGLAGKHRRARGGAAESGRRQGATAYRVTHGHKISRMRRLTANSRPQFVEKARVADLARQTAGTETVNDQMSIEKSKVNSKKERPDA